MPVGSHATYHMSATQSMPATANTWTAFKPTVVEDTNPDGLVTETAASFNIKESGKFLVLGCIPFTNTHNNRNTMKSKILNNAVDIAGSQSSGYERNNANNDASLKFAFMADLTSGDDLTIEWIRDVGDGTVAGNSIADETYFQVIRLTDDVDTAYGFYTDTADTGAYAGQVFDDVLWNSITEETDTAVIERQAGNTAIRLKDIGRYLVMYSVVIDNSSTARTQRISRATLAGTEIPGSRDAVYLRDADNGLGVVTCMFEVNNTIVDQDMEIEIQRGDADVDGTVARVINESGLFVMKLLDSTNIYIGHDQTGGDAFNGTADVVYNSMRSNDIVDTGFSSGAINTMDVILSGMDVIAWGNLFANQTDTAGGERSTRKGVITIESVEQTIGQNIIYGPRGDQGTEDTFYLQLKQA